jgi:hypothetical protein
MGQANVRRWVDDILPLLVEEDVLGVDDFAMHRRPLSKHPRPYEMFQKKQDGVVKVLFHRVSGKASTAATVAARGGRAPSNLG